jgi:hypothetical protein
MKRDAPKHTQGIALVTVLILLVVTTSLVAISSLLALSNRRSSADNLLTMQAQYGAESGIEQVLQKIYYNTRVKFESLKGGSGPVPTATFDICAFKLVLTYTISAANNNTLCNYGWSTSVLTGSPGSAIIPNLYNTKDVTLSGTVGSATYSVKITRKDSAAGDDIEFNFVSTGTMKTVDNRELTTRVLRRTIKIAGSPYPGDRFAMLTNATNCSFCHLQIDTMDRAYAPATSTAPFDRVLVGLLSNNSIDLKFCPNGDGASQMIDTAIGGTMYTRAKSIVYDDTRCTPSEGIMFYTWHSTNKGMVKAGSINTAKGSFLDITNSTPTLNTDASATMIDAKTPTGSKWKYGKAYYNYPDSVSVKGAPWNNTWPDEELPDRFPTIIADDGDRLISDAEWLNYTPDGGKLTGGKIYGVRRPSSSTTTPVGMGTIPISYDPTDGNDIVNSVGATVTLKSTTLTGRTDGSSLVAALGTLFGNAACTAVSCSVPTAAAKTTFIDNWAGWLIQQAIASPNNTDFNFTNPTFYASPTVATSYQSRAFIDVPVNSVVAATSTISTTALPQAIFGNAAANTVRVQFYNVATPNIVAATGFLNANVAKGGTAFKLNALPAGVVAGMRARIYVRWFVPISWADQTRSGALPGAVAAGNVLIADGTGAMENNFDVSYSASTNFLNLRYCLSACATANPVLDTLSIPNVNASVFFPKASNVGTMLTNGVFDGNLIVDGGRINDPTGNEVTIDGTVKINGDLVIRGRIKGTGRFVIRGNIYVVGDVVYDCGGKACSAADYADPNAANIGRIAFLSGSGIMMGDADLSWDFNSSSSTGRVSSFRLQNDQNLQNRRPAKGTLSYNFFNVPGSTGSHDMGGLVSEIIGDMNVRSAGVVAGTRKLMTAPFGFILDGADTYGRSRYEGTSVPFLGTTGLTSIIQLAPSNGPLSVGNNINNGLSDPTGANQMSSTLSCSTSIFRSTSDPALPIAALTPTGTALQSGGFADVSDRSSLNFSTWCPPNAGSFMRNGQTVNGTLGSTPANTAAAWMAQPNQDALLDGGRGMTTGWLGGLLAKDVGGQFTQIGDLGQSKLIKLMWLSTIESTARDADPTTAPVTAQGPLRTDGIFYSPMAIFGVVRNTLADTTAKFVPPNVAAIATSNTNGKWIHNGSMISYELGFLAPGNYTGTFQQTATVETPLANFGPLPTPVSTSTAGPGLRLLYDKRLAGFLGLDAGLEVKIKPVGGYAQVER